MLTQLAVAGLASHPVIKPQIHSVIPVSSRRFETSSGYQAADLKRHPGIKLQI
jgi:hypothetical protein